MISDSTLTGLQPTVTITLKKQRKKLLPKLDFQSCVKPVVFEVKPLGTYFNPFGGGCSVLCNHPVDTDFRPCFSPPRRSSAKIGGRRREVEDRKVPGRRGERFVEKMGRNVGGMLERMGAASNRDPMRKCFTPSGSNRPTLVLDLRRTHSSDNLASAASHGGNEGGKQSVASLSAVTVSSAQTLARTPLPVTKEEVEVGDDVKDDEAPRRRGKKVNKKKKKSGTDKAPKQPSVGIIEPSETQVSAYSEGLIRGDESNEKEADKGSKAKDQQSYEPPRCSIFDLATLRHLRRNMASMDAQAEYSCVWRRVLREAISWSRVMKPPQAEDPALYLPSTDPDQWINLPRLFSLSSARFQLPLDRNTLNTMTPLEYLRDHVVVAKGKKMLYNHVFLKYASKPDQISPPTLIPTKFLWDGLGEVVGGGLDQNARDTLWQFLDWDEDRSIDLLNWYGVCAFTERIIGKETEGRSHLEEADFELLPRVLSTVCPSEKLTSLLKAIHSIGESASVTASPDLWKNLIKIDLNPQPAPITIEEH